MGKTPTNFVEQWMLEHLRKHAGEKLRLTGDNSLYVAYCRACEENKITPMQLQPFARELEILLAIHWDMYKPKSRDRKGTFFYDLCFVEGPEPCPAT